jgi:hypothetical protein
MSTARERGCVHRMSGAVLLAAAFSLLAVVPQQDAAAHPLLATPEQVDAERLLRELVQDPAVKALKASIRADLATSAIGRTPDGAARIDYALDEWTRSLIFKELISDRATPAILWSTNDTPRTWLGYTLGGVGTSGDNPDFIYRAADIAGGGWYEIAGRFDLAYRPRQFVVQAARVQSPAPTPGNANHADLGNTLTTLTDKDLVVKPDGSFRITFGGAKPADSPNHVALEPGDITIGFRDVLADWSQRPARLSIRRLDAGPAGAAVDAARVRAQVLAKLPGYVALWSHFPEKWFGGLQPISIAKPVPREGGRGYLAGIRFRLKPDEAILVTTDPSAAGYAGIQVVDPWMIASDARRYQTSLNLSQARPNADGTYSYVIAASDPGVANWLDRAGLYDGYAILRWQVVPAGLPGDTLVRGFKVIKLADARTIPGVALSGPGQRRIDLATRAQGYASRAR